MTIIKFYMRPRAAKFARLHGLRYNDSAKGGMRKVKVEKGKAAHGLGLKVQG